MEICCRNYFHFVECLPEQLQKFPNWIFNYSACQVGLVSANTCHVKLSYVNELAERVQNLTLSTDFSTDKLL